MLSFVSLRVPAPKAPMTPSEPNAGGYGTVAKLFHWFTALAVLVLIAAGVAMTSEPLAQWADPLFILHKGLGTVLLVVIVLRIGWRIAHPPPTYPEAVGPTQRRLMSLTHISLYVLLVAMTVSGYVRTVGDGFPIELLDALGIPTLLPSMPEIAGVALVVHQVTAYLLTAVVAGHIGAALQDALVERRGVFPRMWPFR